ncbi:MAG: alpha/beta hydrolase [Gemmatimonadetes bacterium]|nr:alpha/beta hydrolase [Gemmatimonadota bacterium]
MALILPLHVETLGRDPGDGVDTFVLLHGYGGSSFTWRHWLGALSARGHVVLVDLKGFGAAPRPDDGRYSPSDQADLVGRLIAERDLKRLTLVGHSLGGGIALLVALRLMAAGDGRLHRLVLVAGAAYSQRLPPFVSLARHPKLSGLLWLLFGSRRIARRVLQSIVYDPSRVTAQQVEGYARPLSRPGARRALIAAALQVVPDDLEQIVHRYPTLRVPALLLWGRGDPVVPLAVGQRLANDLPDATLVVLDACGHLPPEELPNESLAALEEFLDRTERSDGAADGPPASLRLTRP